MISFTTTFCGSLPRAWACTVLHAPRCLVRIPKSSSYGFCPFCIMLPPTLGVLKNLRQACPWGAKMHRDEKLVAHVSKLPHLLGTETQTLRRLQTLGAHGVSAYIFAADEFMVKVKNTRRTYTFPRTVASCLDFQRRRE